MSHSQRLQPPQPLTPPLEPALAQTLIAFWEAIFETSFDQFHEVLLGSELGINDHHLYLVREHDAVVATTVLTISGSNRHLGGLGEVATIPGHRGRGIAAALTQHARDTFLDQGGEALFLGTVNPTAARIYHRLGWRKMGSANVMCLVADGRAPQDFLLKNFRAASDVSFAKGTANARVDMIPLILCPHEQRILDINVGLFSTRYSVQNSCMGLFPRYQALAAADGQWFQATSGDGRLVGLATARPLPNNAWRVDGFAHQNFPGVDRELLRYCLGWVDAQGSPPCLAEVAESDTAKRELFASLGFSDTGVGAACTTEEPAISTITLKRETR